jgi:hypothetical protein
MQQENHPQRVHSNQNPAETNHMMKEDKGQSSNSTKMRRRDDPSGAVCIRLLKLLKYAAIG